MKNILEFLQVTAAALPDKMAVAAEDGCCSWRELLHGSECIGTALAVRTGPRAPVPVLMEKGRHALCAFFGAVQAGCFYVPLNPDLPQPRLRQVLEVLRPSCILTDGIHRELAGQLMPAGEVLQIEDLLQSTPDPAALEHVRAGMTDQDPLYCLFTSGSTGTPKGVVISHRAVLDFIPSFTALFGIGADDFYAAEKLDYDSPFTKEIPNRENRYEGYLFPDTYEFDASATGEDITKRMLLRFSEIWTDEYKNRAKELGMTMDEVVILASIIEREAGNEGEMGKVSSVFHNRLNIDMPLQSCATVQYILKERKSVLSVEDTKIDSPYNTYMYKGLPKGPIASPGKAAINAALYPETTDYLYFKVTSDGVTVFSKTLEEHNSK